MSAEVHPHMTFLHFTYSSSYCPLIVRILLKPIKAKEDGKTNKQTNM
jgi:hypothetical protein